jgi:hypothetical protein
VDEITLAGVSPKAEEREPKVKMALDLAGSRYDYDSLEINDRTKEILVLLAGNPNLRDWCGDTIQKINNAWEYVGAGWPAKDANTEAAVSGAAKVSPYLSEIVFQIALLTIPERLNARLDNKRIGEKLIFADEFGDEVPDKTQQPKVLAEMQRHSAFLHGLVLPDDGVVYKVPMKITGRAGSVLLIGFVAILPFLLALINRVFNGFDDAVYKDGHLDDLMTSYALVLLGAVLHFFIAYTKNRRRDLEPILGEWVLWFSIKRGTFLVSILSIWIVTYAYGRFVEEPDAATSLFLGYSWDSVFDLVRDRFTTKADTAKTSILGSLRLP